MITNDDIKSYVQATDFVFASEILRGKNNNHNYKRTAVSKALW